MWILRVNKDERERLVCLAILHSGWLLAYPEWQERKYVDMTEGVERD